MGLTELRISFKEEKRKAIEGASTGVVLLILKDSKIGGLFEYERVEDVKELYEDKNLSYIRDAFIGNRQDVRVGGVLEERTYTPTKVVVYSITPDDTLDKALEVLESVEFNYMCMPSATDEVENPKLIKFVNETLKELGYGANLIVATNQKQDSSSVINFVMDDVTVDKVTYKANDMLPMICGLCAGTPLSQSITYAVIPMLDNIVKKTKDELDTQIDEGKLVLIKKAGKVRVARGVTSLTTTAGNEKDSFKKIKLVRTYKLINNSIRKSITDFYIGKVGNNYDNKCLLIAEISNFLDELAREGIIDKGFSVSIDLDAQKKYLKENGVDVKALTEQALKEANTGSKVFLILRLKGIDAMEDFNISINV